MSQGKADLAAMDPDYAEHLKSFIDSVPVRPGPVMDILARRSYMHNVSTPSLQQIHSGNLPEESEYTVRDYHVPVGEDQIQVRSLVPQNQDSASDNTRTFPLLLWYHGGGWAAGSIAMDDYYLRRICVDFQISVLMVEYRLAPEFPFPTGIDDAYAALKWAANNNTLISSSLDKGFIVGGISAGGNFAAVVSRRARDDPFFAKQQLTGQILQVPMVIHPNAYPEQFREELTSLERNRDAPLLSKSDIFVCMDALKAPPSDPDFSVLLAADHSKLPPAFIQVAGGDPLCDEGLLYAKILENAGVATRSIVYPGMHHAAHFRIHRAAICQKFWHDFRDGLAWLLSFTKTGQ